jgi:hypothetical protein
MLRVLYKSLKQPFDNLLKDLDEVRTEVDSAVLGEVFYDSKRTSMFTHASTETDVSLDSHQENPCSTSLYVCSHGLCRWLCTRC